MGLRDGGEIETVRLTGVLNSVRRVAGTRTVVAILGMTERLPSNAPVLPVKLSSGSTKTAVIAWLPRGPVVVVSVTVPVGSRGCGAPTGWPSARNCTVPVGLAWLVETAVTTAVRVTG